MSISVLMVGHFISDFLLQSREMGKKKSIHLKWLLMHLGLLSAGMIVFAILVFGDLMIALYFAALNAILHGIIDWNIWKIYKYSVYKRNPNKTLTEIQAWAYWEDRWFYITLGLDQLLHSLCLIALYHVFN